MWWDGIFRIFWENLWFCDKRYVVVKFYIHRNQVVHDHACGVVSCVLKSFVVLSTDAPCSIKSLLPWLLYTEHRQLWFPLQWRHNVIMGAMASQITSLAIFYSTVFSGADQRKHQSSASLAFVWGVHRSPVFWHKWPVTRKMFLFDYVIMRNCSSLLKSCEGSSFFYLLGAL